MTTKKFEEQARAQAHAFIINAYSKIDERDRAKLEGLIEAAITDAHKQGAESVKQPSEEESEKAAERIYPDAPPGVEIDVEGKRMDFKRGALWYRAALARMKEPE